jgi:hypothetical protein
MSTKVRVRRWTNTENTEHFVQILTFFRVFCDSSAASLSALLNASRPVPCGAGTACLMGGMVLVRASAVAHHCENCHVRMHFKCGAPVDGGSTERMRAAHPSFSMLQAHRSVYSHLLHHRLHSHRRHPHRRHHPRKIDLRSLFVHLMKTIRTVNATGMLSFCVGTGELFRTFCRRTPTTNATFQDRQHPGDGRKIQPSVPVTTPP